MQSQCQDLEILYQYFIRKILLHQIGALVSKLLLNNFRYVARSKIQSRNLNKYIIEQLPVVSPDCYEKTKFGTKTATEIILQTVLELTYTANDMVPFARDLGYIDESGKVKPPFKWDEDRRLRLRAKLDALFFNLYGVNDKGDVEYVYSTFPIMRRG